MAYIDVITLDRAKNYLRIDTTLTDDDAEITAMINGACSYIEKRTNLIFYPRNKVYKGSCQVKVYDYPINSIVTDPAPFAYEQPMFTIYPDVKTVELNVGFIDPNDIPDELIQACLQMIKVWYYESEKQINTTLIPESVKEAIDLNRRFI
jgi:hypothetical protein